MEPGRRFSALLQTHTPLRKWHHTHSFSVSLLLEELTNVASVTGWIYCQVRLLDGSFIQESESREVILNSVHWGKEFVFACRTEVNGSTGMLENCMCRISVRRDLEGGKSYKKVGYVDLNLSEFAGSGSVSRCFLLEGYRGNNKLDNSILKIGIQMHLLQGDPCFRVPSQQNTRSQQDSGALGAKVSGVSVESLERQMEMKDRHPDSSGSQNPEEQERAQVEQQLSRVSHTRVDAQDVVDSLCSESFGSADDLPHALEDAELALYVRKDGTTALGVAHKESRDHSEDDVDHVIIME